MQIEKLDIEGLLVIHPDIFEDERGFFYESYNFDKYSKLGLDARFVQDNLSKSQKNVLRGLHFQNPPHAQGKLVQVIHGSVIDVAVDIRKGSKTYGKHHSILLSSKNKTQFYVPPGFAHGFLTLEDDTLFSYKCTDVYHKESEGSILWNDSGLGIEWPTDDPIVSEKDQVAPPFESFKSEF